MGNPINSLTWLINNLALIGKSLPKNSYISTGTCTPAIPIKKGDKVMADFGKLGNVRFIYK
jgi:2-oxo-3-hexenedioate decarboxylase